MTDAQQRRAAKQFAADWQGKGYEKGQSQPFWLSLLQKVLGVEEPEKFIIFEEQVMLDHTSFIDGIIPSTHVLIEQKSLDKDLKKAIKQTDGTWLSPFEQAKRYAWNIPYSQRPRWIVTCNFAEFYVYDMERPNGDPTIIKLSELENEYYLLEFLVDTGNTHIKREMEVSLQAGELVGVLYDAILKQYKNPESEESLKSLNALCVRLVFCLYAEDAGIFGGRGMFHNYLEHHRVEDRLALIQLFRVLDQKPEERDPYLADDLAAFPYVNGGLFADENIEIPRLGDEVIDLILKKASADFDWSAISPTIFGAVFESTLNPETRRSGGMHYTSIENIHKVIDPLFLDSLRAEFEEIKEIAVDKTRKAKLKAFQQKLASLTFLDPACGSGNFLTETYLSLRRIENEVIAELMYGQMQYGEVHDPIQVSIGQFYGIEINDFAVTVAKTALWIAESQMMKETEDVVGTTLEFLPLKSYANITEGNALRLNWEEVVPKRKLNYIMGNPPFCGRRYRTAEQTSDVAKFFKYKDIDYVACWYKRAAEFIQNAYIECAFVSTNSITQGEQVSALWQDLFENHHMCINFAYRTFKWDSEAKEKAAVYCVIIGFSAVPGRSEKFLLAENGIKTPVQNINGYLMDAPNVFVSIRTKPICPVPLMRNGNVPLDGDALKIESKDYSQFSNCMQYVKRLIGGRELLHNEDRYVLWLVGVSPAEIKKFPQIYNRVEQCRNNRLSMKDKGTRKLADTPTTFRDTNNPERYIALPMVSSERRRYIPMAYFNHETIPTNQVQIIPDATLYHLGILTSNVHMAWMRAVCGRLKSDYRYSKDVVYNNFPWPATTEAQKAKIEQTAQAILDARALYPDSSLADLYDEVAMPPELRKAHQQNDRAVMQAYGFPVREMTESKCVAELMKMYQKLTEKR